MNVNIVVKEFNLYSSYYVHFWKKYEPAYPSRYGLNSSATVLLG